MDARTLVGGLVLVAVALVAVALVAIVGLAAARRVDERRERRVEQEVAPVLRRAIAGTLPPAPVPVGRALAPHALAAWLRRREALVGGDDLVAAGHLLGLPVQARRLLATGAGRDRVTAALALGHLGDRRDVPALLAAARRGREPLATAALTALVWLDAPAAVPVLASRLRPGPQPLPPAVAAALVLVHEGRVSAAVRRDAVEHAVERPGLLRLLGLRRDRAALAAVRSVLAGDAAPTEAIAAALHALGDLGAADDAELAARHVDHASWIVRVRATHALARLGGRRYADRFVALLDDPDPWVRRRAAEALAADPRTTVDASRLSPRGRLALTEAVVTAGRATA